MLHNKDNRERMLHNKDNRERIVFYVDRKSKMATNAGHSLTLDPMGKMFQNASSLKPLGQLKPNCSGMIIGRSSTKCVFYMPIGNRRWMPPQDID